MFSTQILKIRIDSITKAEALDFVKNNLENGGHGYIFTPNPEMLVRACNDKSFAETLNKGNINLCDGYGLKLVGYFRKKLINRITGIDFMLDLCRFCRDEYKSIFLLGGKEPDVAEKTRDTLRQMFPGIKIVGVHPGYQVSDLGEKGLEYDVEKNNKLIELISDARPDIIFVAFGMGKQEKWLVENLPKIAKVKIGMGVGGAFDFISGRIPRAPLLMRKIGLEWAYRFYREPQRFKRIFNATVRFLYLASKEKYD